MDETEHKNIAVLIDAFVATETKNTEKTNASEEALAVKKTRLH